MTEKPIAGVALRPNSAYLQSEFRKLRKMFKQRGWEVELEEASGKMIGIKGWKNWELYKRAKILISLGGDGTWLGLARRSLAFSKPILGVHFGNLGFLAEVGNLDLEKWVDRISRNEYDLEERMVLETVIEGPKIARKILSVNEIVIRAKGSGFSHIKFYIGDKYVNGYHGDGLIVSTPTGSTAYNLSAGGPIVYPYSENIILTPISSHSLTQRPLVLPVNCRRMTLKIDQPEGSNVLISDGQEEFEVDKNTTIVIKKSEFKVKVVSDKDNDFFGVLRQKLMWGDHR